MCNAITSITDAIHNFIFLKKFLSEVNLLFYLVIFLTNQSITKVKQGLKLSQHAVLNQKSNEYSN